jgi:CHASE3 domain sensor protein
MTPNWTFGRRIAAGFVATVTLVIVISTLAVYSLRAVVESKDVVITRHAQNLVDIERLAQWSARMVASMRGFFITGENKYLDEVRDRRTQFSAMLDGLRGRVDFANAGSLLDQVKRLDTEYHAAADSVIAMRRTNAPLQAISRAFDEQMQPRRQTLERTLDSLSAAQSQQLAQAKQAATDRASSASTLVIVFAIVTAVLAIALATLLTRALTSQIGASVGQIQSSSAELQSAANQQATATKEQSTAMSEITTTITELLATSRQIAESAQRVAQIAEQTATSARSGDTTVDRAHESINGIRRQVDVIVAHMVELGSKSQQIGGVLDIVSELAEQTNILAINATIEAAGAGEAGKRFAVVADEIRKLADRVATSTKEIRGLIDDVRSSVNTTVMTTETGSKAVEAGARQFSEVTSALKQISAMVGTTTEAAREIELSTKQQSTAVEQVNVAVTNVAQATKETEASAGQTLQTAVELSALSRNLLRLVQPQAHVHVTHAA